MVEVNKPSLAVCPRHVIRTSQSEASVAGLQPMGGGGCDDDVEHIQSL